MLILFYLLGNLHCMGMCGPIAAFLGRHRFRYYYLLGRLVSFSVVGMFSAEMGLVLTAFLRKLHIPALFSFAVGSLILLFALFSLLEKAYPGQKLLARASGQLSVQLGRRLTEDSPWPLFLFGLCTVLLPCGQTVVVFSAIALMQNPLLGLLHGFTFALLTTPALFLAMFSFRKLNYRKWMGIAMLLIGLLAILRGFADLGWISHFGKSHLVIF